MGTKITPATYSRDKEESTKEETGSLPFIQCPTRNLHFTEGGIQFPLLMGTWPQNEKLTLKFCSENPRALHRDKCKTAPHGHLHSWENVRLHGETTPTKISSQLKLEREIRIKNQTCSDKGSWTMVWEGYCTYSTLPSSVS